MKEFCIPVYLILLFGCTKGVEVKKDDPQACVGGAGGAVTIAAYPQHHGRKVMPYQLWIKYNTRELPGTASNYDATVVADTTKDHVKISNLRCGDYYIFMRGYDSVVQSEVIGGVPYTIAESATGELTVNVAVSE